MNHAIYFAACFVFFCLSGTAQSVNSFTKPVFTPASSLFQQKPDSLKSTKFISLHTMIRSIPLAKLQTANLPADYNWGADIRRRENYKQAAFEVRIQDCLGRDVLPNMADLVLQQSLIRNTSITY